MIDESSSNKDRISPGAYVAASIVVAKVLGRQLCEHRYDFCLLFDYVFIFPASNVRS